MPTDLRKAIWSLPGLLLGFLWHLPPLIQCLLLLMLLDVISGIISAAVQGVAITSKTSWRGALKKGLALLLIAATKALCVASNVDAADVAAAVTGFFCLTEMISIVENCDRAGLPVPPILTRMLAAMKDQADSKAPVKKGE